MFVGDALEEYLVEEVQHPRCDREDLDGAKETDADLLICYRRISGLRRDT